MLYFICNKYNFQTRFFENQVRKNALKKFIRSNNIVICTQGLWNHEAFMLVPFFGLLKQCNSLIMT